MILAATGAARRHGRQNFLFVFPTEATERVLGERRTERRFTPKTWRSWRPVAPVAIPRKADAKDDGPV